MAAIQYSGLVTDIKGKIQGSVFQKGSTRNIIRNKGVISKHSTPAQQLQHQMLQKLRGVWLTLSLVEKQAWNVYASTYQKTDKFGTLRNVSGYNYFMSIMANRLQCGILPITTVPSHTIPSAVPTYTMTVDDSGLIIDFGSIQVFNPDWLFVYATDQLNPGYSNFWNKLRLIARTDATAFSSFNASAEWSNIFAKNWPPIGSNGTYSIGVGLLRINNVSGLATPWLLNQATKI